VCQTCSSMLLGHVIWATSRWKLQLESSDTILIATSCWSTPAGWRCLSTDMRSCRLGPTASSSTTRTWGFHFHRVLQRWKSGGIYYFWKLGGEGFNEFEMYSEWIFSGAILSRCSLKYTARQVGNLTFSPKKLTLIENMEEDSEMAAKVILYIGFITLIVWKKGYSDFLETRKTRGISFCQICKHSLSVYFPYVVSE